MAPDSSGLLHLAKVLLSGYRFGPGLSAEELRAVIQPEFTMLQRSLPESEAEEFAKHVEGLLAAIASDGNAPRNTEANPSSNP